MRDILLTLIVFSSLIFILQRPYIGILVWSWLSYMNPHRLTWGFAYTLPFAQVVAITLLIGMVFSRQKMRLPINFTVVVWLIFIGWMSLTTTTALVPDQALEGYIKIIKIQLVTFLTLMLIDDQKKLDQLIWVIVLSIGYFSFKGGVFTLLTGGVSRVWGPPSSFIEENNSLALATLMIIPLAIYLYYISERWYVRAGLAIFVLASVASVFGSQSRGALVAITAVGGFYWLKSNTKLITGVLVVTLAAFGWYFMPQSWHDRMDTIGSYEEDSSAMGRINAWAYNLNLANDRVVGGGLRSESERTFAIYAPDPDDVHSAHSIFFGVLGDHGWIGLGLFLTILFSTWRSLSKVQRHEGTTRDEKNRSVLARMLQISLIAYAAGGAFLSLAYFDLPWHMIAMAVILRELAAPTFQGGSQPSGLSPVRT